MHSIEEMRNDIRTQSIIITLVIVSNSHIYHIYGDAREIIYASIKNISTPSTFVIPIVIFLTIFMPIPGNNILSTSIAHTRDAAATWVGETR